MAKFAAQQKKQAVKSPSISAIHRRVKIKGMSPVDYQVHALQDCPILWVRFEHWWPFFNEPQENRY